MSECNYCLLKRIKRRAHRENLVVTIIGHNVYVHPKDIEVDRLDCKQRGEYFTGWLMAITDHCVC